MKLHIRHLLISTLFLNLVIFSEVSAQTRDILFPVDGEYSFRNDYAEPRGDGSREHRGIDIIADKMTPVVAVVDGTITYIARPEASWGYSITIRDSEGYAYRYLHLNNDTPGTDDGRGGEANAYAKDFRRRDSVERGEIIGWVGDSGNAENTTAHLHFEIRAPDRNYINPYETLLAASPSGTGQFIATVEHPTEVGIEVEEAQVSVVSNIELSRGSRGEAVRTLQMRLKALAYFSEEVTGYFGVITEASVIAFQEANGIDPIGIVGPKTRAALSAEVNAEAIGFTFSKSLKFGSRGDEVRALQLLLKREGYFNEEATGYFGKITEGSVITFQNENNIEPLGIVGPRTRAALNTLE